MKASDRSSATSDEIKYTHSERVCIRGNVCRSVQKLLFLLLLDLFTKTIFVTPTALELCIFGAEIINSIYDITHRRVTEGTRLAELTARQFQNFERTGHGHPLSSSTTLQTAKPTYLLVQQLHVERRDVTDRLTIRCDVIHKQPTHGGHRRVHSEPGEQRGGIRLLASKLQTYSRGLPWGTRDLNPPTASLQCPAHHTASWQPPPSMVAFSGTVLGSAGSGGRGNGGEG